MQLLQQLASALPLESPWTAAIVFGALAWLPIRTIELKIRRWRRKNMDRSILRGGRFTRENATQDSSVLALAIRTVVQYAIDCCSWKKKVLFEKHSDGSVLSKRYVYDRQKAPQDAVLQVQIQTPSPVIPHKRRSRVATPTTKMKSSSSNNKENENPISPGVDTKARPSEEESKTSRNHFETTSTQSQQPIDFRLSPYDRSKKPSHGLAMVPYRPQPVPLGPAAKQPYFLDKPLDPHFFQAYAPRRSFIMQVNPKSTENGSSNSKKRKLEVDSFQGPRKRPSLSRAHDARTFRRKPADPQKRKAREEELLLEFSRKRPKKEAKKVDSAVKVVPNPFAPAGEDGKSDGKPTFQFGATLATAAASDDKKSDGKPVFQFGSAASTTEASEDKKSDGKPAFQFGATTTPTASSDDNKSDGKPAFQFGAASSSTTSAPSDDNKSEGKPAFQFGAASSSTTSLTGTNAQAVQPAFQFGAASVSSLTDAPAGDSTSVATVQAADVQKPSFTFGASASAPAGPSVAVTTGAPVTATEAPAPKPAFSFGSSAHAEVAGAPQPAFAFGGAAPAATGVNNSNLFSFGGSGTPSAFGAPGGAMLPGPVNRGGALRRRAGRTVGGRSVRRGAA
ncbi:hypothetical protein MHU86_17296 [Fragilaria crotonensis]|nr:hypothetical protein MHU86_17296 [Fragilaria crotonensis]